MECAEMCSTFTCALAWGDRHAEAVVALLALIVAVVTARALMTQSKTALADSQLAREHNRLSVRPFLDVHYDQKINPQYRFPDGSIGRALEHKTVLSNIGLGPARVTKFEVLLDGKALDISDVAMIEPVFKGIFGSYIAWLNFFYSHASSQKFGLRPQDDRVFLHLIVRANTDAEIDQIRKSLRRFDLRVESESLYGEPEIYDSRLKERPA
jgi:hypothetical protein